MKKNKIMKQFILLILFIVLCSFSALATSMNDYTSNLVGYWGMETTSFLDTSLDSFQANGTNSGTVTLNTSGCFYGNCSDFPNTGYLDLTAHTSLRPVHVTVMTWIKSHDISEYGFILGSKNAPGIANDGYKLDFRSNIFGTVGRESESVGATVDYNNLTNEVWSLLTMTFNGSRTSLYINSTLINYTDDAVVGDINYSSSAALLIGDQPLGVTYLDAMLDELMIFNTSLPQSAITDSWNDGIGKYFNGSEFVTIGTVMNDYTYDLIGYWGMETTDWLDTSLDSFQANGTNSGNVTLDTSGCFRGNCSDFPNTGYLNLTNHTSLRPAHVTVMTWIKSHDISEIGFILGSKAFIYPDKHGYMVSFDSHILGNIGRESDSVQTTMDYNNLTNEVWSLLTMTFNGSRTSLYINSTLINYTDDAVVGDINYSKCSDLLIGKRPIDDFFLNASLDELMIFNTSLPQSAITDSWNDGIGKYFNGSEFVNVTQIPSITYLNLTPLSPITTDNLVITSTCIDDNLDDILTTYIQMYNGTSYGTIQSSTVTNGVQTNFYNLSSSITSHKDIWIAEIWCGDGALNSTKSNTSSITILNSQPTAPSLSNITNTHHLSQSINFTGSTDIDSDIMNYSISVDSSGYTTAGDTYLNSSLSNTFLITGLSYGGASKTYYISIWADDQQNATNSNSSIYNVSFAVTNAQPSIGLSNITADTGTNYADATYGIIDYGAFTDTDNDAIDGYVYQWRNGTTNITSETNSTLICSGYPTTHCAKGQIINVLIAAYDNTTASNNLSTYIRSSNITIDNKPPVISNIDLQPNNPNASNDLNCSTYSWSDIDSDAEDTHLYKWFMNDTVQAGLTTELVDSGNTTTNDIWHCEITPYDGTDYGTAVNSSTETIGFGGPSIGVFNSSTSSGSPVNVGSIVTFLSTWSDADSAGTRMYICNTSVITAAGCDDGTYCSTTNSSNNPQECNYTILEDDTWTNDFYISICDDTDQCSASSTDIFYANHAPNVTNAIVIPASPYTNNTLTCNYTWYDRDGDIDSSTYQWFRYNKTAASWTTLSETTVSLTSTDTSKNNSYLCEISPIDHFSFAGTIINSTNITVVNSLPYMTSLTINDTNPQNTEDFSCSYSYNDYDNDAENETNMRWYIGGVLNASFNNISIIQSANTSYNQNWICEVKVFDYENYSDWSNTSSVFINDSVAPVISYTNVSDTSVTVDTVLTFYANVSDTNTNITEVNITFSDPDNTIYEITMSEIVSGQWRLNRTMALVGAWSYINVTAWDYVNLSTTSSPGINITVTAAPSAPAGGGGGAAPVTIEVTEITYLEFCGDNICSGNETPFTCWVDCAVNIDNVITCLWTDPKSCIYSESWFATFIIYFLIGMAGFVVYRIEAKSRKKRNRGKKKK